MGMIEKIIVPVNFILTTALTSILVFDRYDENQRKYIKAIWFLLGGVGVVYAYKFSKLGDLLDETLESDIFDSVLDHQLT